MVILHQQAPLGENKPLPPVCASAFAGMEPVSSSVPNTEPSRLLSGNRQAKSAQSDLFCCCVLLGVFPPKRTHCSSCSLFSTAAQRKRTRATIGQRWLDGLGATPTDVVWALPLLLSTPLQRHLIMKTLTHLHGYVWSKLHSKPHQIRIICECKTLFPPLSAPRSELCRAHVQMMKRGFTVFQHPLETWAESHPVDWEGQSPTIIPGSDLHPHPSHTQIRRRLLWLIRHTGSTVITICQWLAGLIAGAYYAFMFS